MKQIEFQNTTLLNLSAPIMLNGTLSGTASSGDSQVWLQGKGAKDPAISDATQFMGLEVELIE